VNAAGLIWIVLGALAYYAGSRRWRLRLRLIAVPFICFELAVFVSFGDLRYAASRTFSILQITGFCWCLATAASWLYHRFKPSKGSRIIL
jgi:hypothetical protein